MPYCPAHIFTAQCSDDCALADCNDLVISLQHGSRPVAGRGLIKYFFPNLISGWSVVQARRDRDPPRLPPLHNVSVCYDFIRTTLAVFLFFIICCQLTCLQPSWETPSGFTTHGLFKALPLPRMPQRSDLGGRKMWPHWAAPSCERVWLCEC